MKIESVIINEIINDVEGVVQVHFSQWPKPQCLVGLFMVDRTCVISKATATPNKEHTKHLG